MDRFWIEYYGSAEKAFQEIQKSKKKLSKKEIAIRKEREDFLRHNQNGKFGSIY